MAQVAGLRVQADAVVEGEALAAGVGHCVAWPGGPQQLLVLQPHAVVQSGSTSATATNLGSCSVGCFAEFGLVDRSNPCG